jgi:Na+-driven multidrug efflux pump
MMQLSSADGGSITYQAGAYLLGRAPSLVLEVLVSAFSVTLVSWGRVRVPLVVFVVTSGVNLALDVPLVYGIGVLPPLGAFGDGLASTVGVALALPWLAHAVHRMSVADETDEAAHRFAGWRKTTMPAVGSAALDYAGNIAFTALIAIGGISGLAGARIATASHLLAFALVASLASAALYLLGASYDRDPYVALRLRNSLRVRFIWLSSALGAGVAALSWPVAVLSTADPDVRQAATALGLVVAAACPFMGWTYANVAVLRAMEKTGSDFVSNVIAVWGAQIPLAAAGLAIWGAPGGFSGLMGYWMCRGMLTHRQVRRAARAVPPQGASGSDAAHD